MHSEQEAAVTLSRPFEISEHEVTQGEWMKLGLTNPSGLMADGTGDCLEAECPVGNVTWFEAAAFANLLSQQHAPPLEPCYVLEGCTGSLGTGMRCQSARTAAPTLYECEGYRLPTFSEWEYAARAGRSTAFTNGDITEKDGGFTVCSDDPVLFASAWYCANAGPSTHRVCEKEKNAWGLCDVSGNAGEWVNDRYSGVAAVGPLTDPGAILPTATADARIWRGGAFNAPPSACRIASQLWAGPEERGPGLGFRLVRSLR